jgi:hypothetical protein
MDLQPLSPETAWAVIATLLGLWQVYVSKHPADVFKKAANLPKSNLASAGPFEKTF